MPGHWLLICPFGPVGYYIYFGPNSPFRCNWPDRALPFTGTSLNMMYASVWGALSKTAYCSMMPKSTRG